MKWIPVYIILFLLSIISSCNRHECPPGFDFSKEDEQLMPYRNDSILVFKNEKGVTDSFFISKVKRLVDKGYEIETSSNDWLELEIFYTNKNFPDPPEKTRQLAWITKGCKSKGIGITGSWLDFWDGLNFKTGTPLSNYSYPDTLSSFPFNGDTLNNILRFQTDTTVWPDAKECDVKTVYWLAGEGVIMYETRSSGIWKKIR